MTRPFCCFSATNLHWIYFQLVHHFVCQIWRLKILQLRRIIKKWLLLKFFVTSSSSTRNICRNSSPRFVIIFVVSEFKLKNHSIKQTFVEIFFIFVTGNRRLASLRQRNLDRRCCCWGFLVGRRRFTCTIGRRKCK